MYDPGTADEWKHDVTQQGHHRMPKQPYTCPLAVRLIFYLPRPQRLSRKCDPAHALPCTAKPDVDNLAKSTLDAMTEAGWWADDALVAELHVVKLYAAKEGRIGALIEVASFHLEPMETV
jgi:Holliday junction resolvase RusA-like endonuclease